MTNEKKRMEKIMATYITSNKRFDLHKRIINMPYLTFGQCCAIDTFACKFRRKRNTIKY